MGKLCLQLLSAVFDSVLFILADIEGLQESLDEIEFRSDRTTDYGATEIDVSTFSRSLLIRSIFIFAGQEDINKRSLNNR